MPYFCINISFKKYCPSFLLQASSLAIAAAFAGVFSGITVATPSQAGDADMKPLLGSAPGLVRHERSLTAAYLAAQAALSRNDIAAAALFYRQAVAHRPTDISLLNNAMLFSLLNGDVAEAAIMAERLQALDKADPAAKTMLLVQAIYDGNFTEAHQLLQDEETLAASPLFLQRLLQGWGAASLKDIAGAEQAFGTITEWETAAPNATDMIGAYHLGLMQALLGDNAAAAVTLSAMHTTAQEMEPALAWNRRVILALCSALSHNGQAEEAAALLAKGLEKNGDDPLLNHAASLLAQQQPLPLIAASTQQGFAEALYTLASILADDRRSQRQALLYAQLAYYIHQEFDEALILIGELQMALQQYTVASDAFARVDPAGPYSEIGVLGAVMALRRDDKLEMALETLEGHMAAMAQPSIKMALAQASLQQALGQFALCAASYEVALQKLEQEQGGLTQQAWPEVFGHSICLERSGDWDKAEASLRETLVLAPDQPEVLNYLGYSLVEKQQKLDEALDMLRLAAQARPRSGHIIDSLGWALYRTGAFKEAAEMLQKAVALEPTIAVINDHLGDALWMIGRHMEAQYQWKRALSLEDDQGEVDPERVKAKLAHGLDHVLAKEAEQKQSPMQ